MDFGVILASNVGAGVRSVKGPPGGRFVRLWGTWIRLSFVKVTVWLHGRSEALYIPGTVYEP